MTRDLAFADPDEAIIVSSATRIIDRVSFLPVRENSQLSRDAGFLAYRGCRGCRDIKLLPEAAFSCLDALSESIAHFSCHEYGYLNVLLSGRTAARLFPPAQTLIARSFVRETQR